MKIDGFDTSHYYMKSSRGYYFLAINLIAHLALIPAILYAEWWMWVLGILWGYWINCTCYTAGYHRYYCHKAFKAPRWYDYYFQFVSLFGNPGPVLIWNGIHKLHHKYSDTDYDPHGPTHRGFLNVWTIQLRGALYFLPPTKEDLKDWLKDTKDPTAKWFYDNYLLFIGIIMIVLLLMGPWFFVFGFCVPILLTHHASAVVNAYSHRTGKPSNIGALLNFIVAGEGFHLNHHKDPSNYTTLLPNHKWWEIDLTGLFIKMIRI